MCKTDDIIACVAGVRKERGREFRCEIAREGEGSGEHVPSLLPRAPLALFSPPQSAFPSLWEARHARRLIT